MKTRRVVCMWRSCSHSIGRIEEIEEIEEMRNALSSHPPSRQHQQQDRPRGEKRQKMRRHEVSCFLITTTKWYPVFVNSNWGGGGHNCCKLSCLVSCHLFVSPVDCLSLMCFIVICIFAWPSSRRLVIDCLPSSDVSFFPMAPHSHFLYVDGCCVSWLRWRWSSSSCAGCESLRETHCESLAALESPVQWPGVISAVSPCVCCCASCACEVEVK